MPYIICSPTANYRLISVSIDVFVVLCSKRSSVYTNSWHQLAQTLNTSLCLLRPKAYHSGYEWWAPRLQSSISVWLSVSEKAFLDQSVPEHSLTHKRHGFILLTLFSINNFKVLFYTKFWRKIFSFFSQELRITLLYFMTFKGRKIFLHLFWQFYVIFFSGTLLLVGAHSWLPVLLLQSIILAPDFGA